MRTECQRKIIIIHFLLYSLFRSIPDHSHPNFLAHISLAPQGKYSVVRIASMLSPKDTDGKTAQDVGIASYEGNIGIMQTQRIRL